MKRTTAVACTLAIAVPGLILLGLDTVGAQPGDDGTTLTKVGDKVPEFEVVTLNGRTVKGAELEGGVTVINLFATWCGPCVAEAPALQKAWERFQGRSDRFLVLGIAREQAATDLAPFRDDHKLTYVLAPDPERSAYKLFATQWIPRTYVVDIEGKIAYQSRGYTPDEFKELLDVVERELARLKPSES
jgi:peroxiredoxin